MDEIKKSQISQEYEFTSLEDIFQYHPVSSFLNWFPSRFFIIKKYIFISI